MTSYQACTRGAPLLRPMQEILEERRKFNQAEFKRRIGHLRLDRFVFLDESNLFAKETENV